MSIIGAMFSGVSGLAAQSQALGMISDNISNVNTVGYKDTSAAFETLVTASGIVNTYSPGGTRALPVQHIDQQGLLQSTENLTDVAVVGEGFFVVNEAANPGLGNEYLFTRAGSFRADENGDLVNTSGYFLQGWPLDAAGNLPANTTVVNSLQTINVANLTGTAVPTANVEMRLNLPSTAVDGDTYSATVQIFDSLGNPHNLQVDFTYNTDGVPAPAVPIPRWDITVQDPTLVSTGAVSGTVTAPVTRWMTFNGDGTPNTITFPNVDITWTAVPASASNIAFDVGTANLTDGITQFAGTFSVDFLDQDGVRFGSFSNVVIGEDGIVSAVFDNGEQRDIYQLALARFANPNGLVPRNGNAYLQSEGSGLVLLLQPNTGGAGVIESQALESSTVDIAEEFTNMIVTQRAYSASARIITTADEMLEELIRVTR